MPRPRITLSSTVLDAPQARPLAEFYRRLLGWEAIEDEPDWVVLRPVDGGAGLSFQSEGSYQPPTWPATADEQQMMLHLDFEVDDLAAASAHAQTCGSALAPFQPQDHVRVHFDPAGHPFCLFVEES